jgi:predicted MFS family arabinose efflux permease
VSETSRIRLRSLGILFAATIAIAIGGIHYHVVGAMVRPLSNAYGWSRGEIAFALTISSFIHPFTNICVGLLADRFSLRAIALPGIVGFAVGTALLGFAGGEIWTWYAAYVAFSILGAGASSIVFTKLVVQHFTRRRGLALATSLAGSGLLVSTVPAIILALENSVGLRLIYPVLAICAFILMFLPAWLFLPREPASIKADNRSPKGSSQWREAIGSTILWRLVLCFFVIASSVGTFIVHFQPMMADAGLSRADAAKVALLIGPAMIVGRLGTGVLFDILPTRLVAACAFSLPAFACLWILAVPLDFAGASMLAVLIGIGMGSEVDVVAYMSSRYFGMRRYGLVFAILISIYGFAVGTASWLVGKVFDRFGSYDPALQILIPAIVAAVVLVLSLGRPPELDVEGNPKAG